MRKDRVEKIANVHFFPISTRMRAMCPNSSWGRKVSGFAGNASLHLLDATSFDAAIKNPDFLKSSGKSLKKVGTISLGPYAIARINSVPR